MSAKRIARSTGAGLIDLGRRVFALTKRVEVTFLAAAIAYYGLVSVVPGLILALAIATALGGPGLAERMLTLSGTVMTEGGQAVIADALGQPGGRSGTTVLGIVVLLWGALKGFRGLDRAFSRIYGTVGEKSLLHGLLDALIGLAGVGTAFLLMVILGGILAALQLPAIGWIGGLVVLLVGLFVAFLPFYVRFPDTDVALREAVPGAAVVAIGWVGLQTAFQGYASVASGGDLYGVLGGVLLLVTWFYFAAILILLGAVFNVVLAGRDGDRQREKPGGREG